MKVVYLPHGLELNRPSPGYERTPGLHMSEIYNDLYKGLDPKRFDKGGPPDAVKMEFGTAFEEVLEPALAMRVFGLAERPMEFACLPSGKVCPLGTPNSIIFSPDHLFFQGSRMILGEFKVTWMSISKGITDKRFDKWFTQVKAYSFPLKVEDLHLFALFVNGHYKWKDLAVPGVHYEGHPKGFCPQGPLLLSWQVKFTARDLETNWNMLMRHARKKGMLV